jgi:hypothetical protein
MKKVILGFLMASVPCIVLSASLDASIPHDIPGGVVDLIEAAKDDSPDQKHCMDVAESNRPLRKQHSDLRKNYKKLITAIRKHFDDKHCKSDAHALLLPIENKALEEKIKGLQEIIKNENIQVGG